MSAEGWISLGLSMFCAVLTACVGPEWIKAAGELDVLAMTSWTATFAFAGIFVGIGIGRIIGGAKHEHAPNYFERRRMEREEREREERERAEREERLQALDRKHIRQQVVFQDSSFVSMFGDGGLLQSIQSLPPDWLRTLLLVYNEGMMTSESENQDAIMGELEHQGLLQVVGNRPSWKRRRLTYAVPQHVRMVIARNRELLEEMTQIPS